MGTSICTLIWAALNIWELKKESSGEQPMTVIDSCYIARVYIST